MKNRVFGLDLVRTIAIFLVISVHSFLHSGFNSVSLSGFGMFSLLFVRGICHSGVLIFMILTGYLKSNKKLDKDYFKSIWTILISYFLASIVTIIFRRFFLHDGASLIVLTRGIFNFTTIPYAWYVEMYLGLFFFIPFLNILYKNIDGKKNKQILLIILFLFSSLFPTLSNVMIGEFPLDIYPNWWFFLYPVLLYYIGCYLREYPIHIHKGVNLAILAFFAFLNAFILYFYLNGQPIASLHFLEYYSFSIIISTLIFLFAYDIHNEGKIIPNIFYFLSKVSFCTYLISYCFDAFVYQHFSFLSHHHYYFFICTFLFSPVIFLAASCVGYMIDSVSNFIQKLFFKPKKDD